MFNGHSNMHGSYVWGRGGGGGVSDFCVTYHLTQTMDSEVFPLLWDMIGAVEVFPLLWDIVRTLCNA